jgi:hypothetical protein
MGGDSDDITYTKTCRGTQQWGESTVHAVVWPLFSVQTDTRASLVLDLCRTSEIIRA